MTTSLFMTTSFRRALALYPRRGQRSWNGARLADRATGYRAVERNQPPSRHASKRRRTDPPLVHCIGTRTRLASVDSVSCCRYPAGVRPTTLLPWDHSPRQPGLLLQDGVERLTVLHAGPAPRPLELAQARATTAA